MSDKELPFDLGGLMDKARELQTRMKEAQQAASAIVAEGNAGGGMVVVQANGHGKLVSIRIEPGLLASGDKELLEDLVLAAANQAVGRARDLSQEELRKATGGLPIPIDLSELA